jgi:SAM-dependent methyltransferase
MTFAGRVPTDAELEAYYADYGHAWEDSPITRRRYDELLASFAAHRSTNRLLDVGCGAGYFLEAAQTRGWEAHGTELSERAMEITAAKGLRVASATEDPFEPGSFDVITAFEVVEHVRDPGAEAAALARWLRPGGLLYVTTPNFNAASRRILRDRWSVIAYPEHLSYFTPDTLRTWLGRVGLQPVAVTSTGVSLARLRSGLTTCDASPAPAGDQRLQVAIEGSVALRAAKRAANATLGLFGAGDTLKARFVLR